MNKDILLVGLVAVGVFIAFRAMAGQGDKWIRLDSINGIPIDHSRSVYA